MLHNNIVKVEAMKIKLKSAIKLKLNKERDLYEVHNKKRSRNEELLRIKAENEFIQEQVEEVQNQIAQARHQISMIGICSTSEQCKIDAHVDNLERHRKGFQELFDKESDFFNLRLKEIRKKETEEEEMMRQKERELAEIREHDARETAKVEAECETLQRECAVLKKRNNAIMLKLRRKLVETENIRRELAKQNVK